MDSLLTFCLWILFYFKSNKFSLFIRKKIRLNFSNSMINDPQLLYHYYYTIYSRNDFVFFIQKISFYPDNRYSSQMYHGLSNWILNVKVENN